ncbi:MAG: hypothetical protein M3Q52_06140 [Pseudomonadota bacterium]|nr:hypothetical protein [Pseudomonadota bacterium]
MSKHWRPDDNVVRGRGPRRRGRAGGDWLRPGAYAAPVGFEPDAQRGRGQRGRVHLGSLLVIGFMVGATAALEFVPSGWLGGVSAQGAVQTNNR